MPRTLEENGCRGIRIRSARRRRRRAEWSPTGSSRACAAVTPRERGAWTVIGEEDRHPYDRVGLTSFFAGASPDELTLERSILDDDERVRFVRGDAVARIDREARRVRPRAAA